MNGTFISLSACQQWCVSNYNSGCAGVDYVPSSSPTCWSLSNTTVNNTEPLDGVVHSAVIQTCSSGLASSKASTAVTAITSAIIAPGRQYIPQ